MTASSAAALVRGRRLAPPRKDASSAVWGRYIRRLVTKLGACLSTLSPRARQILVWRAGLDGTRARSQKQVAQLLGISVRRERVLERNAATALRDAARAGVCGKAVSGGALPSSLALLPAGVQEDIVYSSAPAGAGASVTAPGPTATTRAAKRRRHSRPVTRIRTAAGGVLPLSQPGLSSTEPLLIALAVLVACAMATLVGRQVLPARSAPRRSRRSRRSRPPLVQPKPKAAVPAAVAPAPDPGSEPTAEPAGTVMAAAEAAELGTLLAERGDYAGARDALRHADEQGDALAASNLGVLLEQEGDIEGAAAAYRRADERGDANGAFNLGGLLAQRGDIDGALDAFHRAAERGDASAGASAGILLEQRGDIDEAIAAYRHSSEAGNPDGSFSLGALLAREGDVSGAVHAYRQAAQQGDEELSRRAHAALAALQKSRNV